MSYQVLARKWRPKKFSDIVGQEHIIQSITHTFLLNKIHHAYILAGTRGVGKTTIARLFAKGLNCEQGVTYTMCGQCNNCKDIELGCFIDLIEIDAASRTKVEDTREFLDNVQYMPSRGRFKVYLIDEVHMLSRHSFNALLKTLEEPPTHVKFILITTEYQKLPETILSRCLQFYLKPLNISQIITQLTYIFHKENINIETSALEALAYASKGSMRDALSLAEQAIVLGNNEITNSVINNMFGISNIEHPLCLIESLIDEDIHSIMHQIENLTVSGIHWDYVFNEILTIFQKIAIGQFLSNSVQKEDENVTQHINQRIRKLSNRITPENVQLYYQIFLLGRRELPYVPSHRMGIEMTMLRALAFRPDIDIVNKKNNNGNNNILSKSTCSDNNNEINTNDTQHIATDIFQKRNHNQDNENVLNTEKSKKKNNILLLNFKKPELHLDNTKPKISKFVSDKDITDITSTILEARSKLLQYKERNKLNVIKKKSNLTTESQKKTKDILERFASINTIILKNRSDRFDKINKDLSGYLEFNNNSNDKKTLNKNHQNTSDFIKEILQKAINNDLWISQIYRLSLPKLAKKLVMNSWKEKISSDEICLHVRSDYQHLNSTELRNIIQKSISNNMGTPIKLHIKKDDNYAIKTPMEYLHALYKEKISLIKQEFSSDPYVKMIKSFFDAEIDENDIQVLYDQNKNL
ncbi:DNA polymerase III subunit gamma/tau [Blochmannia endosymbiont of Camponotus sp.]|uniref:DNA polymerase III subunit gamma/tau n=1 Tax=Blochmannia endosymbiont of Camponotus sp. TaxID=700220 RepID=UPI002025506B|nr:DNA polymerase III subunit gamma/tau [Blochmannia endosymbiont of Camponotus sp.]URJ32589.1 DNA polymerase III subunit gamma/tau [Blochmannia endosymbiont of Camponotus sp.]